MKSSRNLTTFLLSGILILTVSCQGNLTGNGPDLSDSLDPVEALSVIPGAENSTIVVNENREKQAYFTLEFRGIESNDMIANGIDDGWCIDVFKPISSNNAEYNNIKLYSSYRVEKWKPVNYLLNIEEELRSQDPELTWLEIQLAIWSLRANPKFDLDEVAIEDLPGQFRKDGQPTFNREKVDQLLNKVEKGYREFDYTQKGAKFAIVAEMPVDVQTLITVVEVK